MIDEQQTEDCEDCKAPQPADLAVCSMRTCLHSVVSHCDADSCLIRDCAGGTCNTVGSAEDADRVGLLVQAARA